MNYKNFYVTFEVWDEESQGYFHDCTERMTYEGALRLFNLLASKVDADVPQVELCERTDEEVIVHKIAEAIEGEEK